MRPEFNRAWMPTGAAYTGLHSPIAAVAHAVKAGQVCLVSSDGSPECVTLVASDEVEPGEGKAYVSGENDVSVPVCYRDRELARLVVVDARADVNRDSLVAFARAVGYLLGHAEDINEAQYAVEETRVLREIGLQFGAPTELSHLLDSVVKGVRRVLGADYANLTTVDEDGTRQWLAMDGYCTDAYKQFAYRKGIGTTGRIMKERGPVLLEGIGTSPDLPAAEFPVHTAEGGVSVLAVPLMMKGTPIGALTLGSRSPRHWKPNDVQLASVVANGAAIAIDQSRASKAERTQRAFLEKVIENFPGVLMVLGPPPDWRVVVANSQFNKFLPEPYRSGGSIAGLTAKEISTGDHSEQGRAMTQLLERVFETGEPVSFEQFQSENAFVGTTYWNWVAVPIDNVGEQGERVLMLIAHDITESVTARRNQERSAELARARAAELDTVISHMADGMAIFDEHGELVRINPAGVELLGQGVVKGSLPQQRPEQYGLYTATGELFELKQLPSLRALKGEIVTGEIMLVRRPDREDAIIRVSCSPLTDPEGHINGAVAVFHDITQDKMVERLKDEFLSIVSHEVRTPLTAIIGYSDLMLRGVHGSLAERQGKVLKSVRANAGRLLRLINDLLDVSKLESGSMQLNSDLADIAALTTTILAQIRIVASNNGVEVHNLLPDRRLNKVIGDEQKLQQIIENLVTNAIKFTPGGTVTVDAYLSLLAPNDPALCEQEPFAEPPPDSDARSLVVSVRDSGAGLEQGQLEHIWDRFYQADTSVKRRSGGAGLGLTIVRSLVELHGGQIWATSGGEGKGSTFSFSLPIAPGEFASRPKGNRTSPGWRRDQERTHEQRPAIGTVLVVEDDADQREIICEMLELEGFEVAMAETGEEAVEMALELQPSAIALDVILPRQDGWQVLQQLRSHSTTKDIPVLIISVVDQAEFGKKMGADGYLLKPLDSGILRTAMRRLMQTGRKGGPATRDKSA